jgi:hypothetical protein
MPDADIQFCMPASGHNSHPMLLKDADHYPEAPPPADATARRTASMTLLSPSQNREFSSAERLKLPAVSVLSIATNDAPGLARTRRRGPAMRSQLPARIIGYVPCRDGCKQALLQLRRALRRLREIAPLRFPKLTQVIPKREDFRRFWARCSLSHRLQNCHRGTRGRSQES